MSEPVTWDFARVKFGDGADPEVFTVVCDLIQVSVNETAETQARSRWDCTKPGAIPTTRRRVTGTNWTITGTGLPDNDQNAPLRALLGKVANYQVEMYRNDGTDAGELQGTYSGKAIMTTRNIRTDRAGDAAQEITLEGEGVLSWAVEP